MGEGHLRWDSLGEFLALAVSLEEIGVKKKSKKIEALAAALNEANEKFLDANKNPSRKVKEIDNRGSHFYFALYWAQALAKSENSDMKKKFGPIAKALEEKEEGICLHETKQDFQQYCQQNQVNSWFDRFFASFIFDFIAINRSKSGTEADSFTHFTSEAWKPTAASS